MRIQLFAIAASAALLCGPATAAADWQKVSLKNNITIEVPAAVGQNYIPTKPDAEQGALMAYILRHSDGYTGCWLSKLPYTAQFTRQTAVAHLAVKQRICNAFNQDAGKLHVVQWGPKMSNGQPAAGCVFSYPLAAGDARGGTNQNMMVAAPDNAYLLLCLVRAHSQADAEKQWSATWAGPFGHIQQSLHLPNAKP
jgi:hypothetical protein